MIDKKLKKELKARANTLNVVARVGKDGITPQVIAEVDKLIKKHKLVKVKLLKSMLEGKDKNEAALELAQKTNSELVDLIGFVAILYKK